MRSDQLLLTENDGPDVTLLHDNEDKIVGDLLQKPSIAAT